MRIALAFILAVSAFSCFGQSGSGITAPKAAAASGLVDVVSCDCTSYPFKPNPPCFGSCVGKLASAPHSDLTSVKGLDPGVAVSIKVLAANPQKATIDFTQMRGKSDLEQAADRSFRGNELRFEPSRNKYQMQR
jgi:hypothetical protein